MQFRTLASYSPFVASALLLMACSEGTGDLEPIDDGSGAAAGTGGAGSGGLGSGGIGSGGLGSGGGLASGGSSGSGGDTGSGGVATTGGTSATGGAESTGGANSTGGMNGSGGASPDDCDVSVRPASPAGGYAHSVTGGNGGSVITASTGTAIHAAICGRANDDTPLIIMVDGTITPGNTSKQSGSCNTADGVIELKDISNVSLIGVGTKGVLDQIGVHIRSSSNIIVQNLTIKNVRKSNTDTPSNGGDAIGMESDVDRVWIDHNLIFGSTPDGEEHDGLIDFKSNTTNVTVSYNHLHTGGRGGLIASSDSGDDGSTNVTFHHNWYQNLTSRTHLIREADAHIYNNYYIDIHSTGINARNGAHLLIEGNYFTEARNPLGTFYYLTNPGVWQVEDNTFDTSVVWEEAEDEKPAGPNVESTGSVSVAYDYSVDPSECVPAIVQANAGVGKL